MTDSQLSNRDHVLGLYGPDPSKVPAGDDFGDMAYADLPFACGFDTRDFSAIADDATDDAREDYEEALSRARTWEQAAEALTAFVFTVVPEEEWS